MADQMSMDYNLSEIISQVEKDIQGVSDSIKTLDEKIINLPNPGTGGWKGNSADKFMNSYFEVQSKIKEFPDLLTQINQNLNTNYQNFVNADGA